MDPDERLARAFPGAELIKHDLWTCNHPGCQDVAFHARYITDQEDSLDAILYIAGIR